MKSPLNVAFLTHNYPRTRDDYAGIFISLLARRLVPLGIRPVVVAPHDLDLPEHEETDGVRIYRFRYANTPQQQTLAYRGDMHKQVLRLPFGPLKYRRFLRSFAETTRTVLMRENIDVVAAHWLVPAGMVVRRLLPELQVPVVLYSHGTDVRLFTRFAPLLRKYYRPMWNSVYRWLVVSSFLKDEILKVAPETADLLEVLPLPHDEKVFYRDEEITKADNLVIAVTRFTEQKRVDELIRAFHWVVREERSARLEIYGTGPLEQRIRALIDELALAGQVIIHSPVSQTQLREIYNRAAVVVLNSSHEGFGLALSEAMMCGTAVVGTASGGIPDIIEHRRRGLLVDPDNITALAESIISLLRNRPLREKLAKSGYQYARLQFASAPLARRNADLFREAAGQSS